MGQFIFVRPFPCLEELQNWIVKKSGGVRWGGRPLAASCGILPYLIHAEFAVRICVILLEHQLFKIFNVTFQFVLCKGNQTKLTRIIYCKHSYYRCRLSFFYSLSRKLRPQCLSWELHRHGLP
jgi:hypothetical protein